jgi:flagellar basal-body rod protein FlgB
MNTATPLLTTLENYLRLTTAREQAIASNMANIDTPGYHTRDINFQGELKRVMTSVVRQSDGYPTTESNPAPREVSGLMERPDANNVSLEYQFHQILSAINGGGQS